MSATSDRPSIHKTTNVAASAEVVHPKAGRDNAAIRTAGEASGVRVVPAGAVVVPAGPVVVEPRVRVPRLPREAVEAGGQRAVVGDQLAEGGGVGRGVPDARVAGADVADRRLDRPLVVGRKVNSDRASL